MFQKLFKVMYWDIYESITVALHLNKGEGVNSYPLHSLPDQPLHEGR